MPASLALSVHSIDTAEVKALVQRGPPEQALETLRALERIAPDDARIQRGYGIVYERIEKPAEARAAYARFLELDPKHPDARIIRRRLSRLNE